VDAVLGVYELNRIELLRDVYVWAYERSCQQYVAVKQQLNPPDIFRLRYRNELDDVIRGIVHAGQPVHEDKIHELISEKVDLGDKQRFVQLVQEEFKTLHAGNAIRFGLRPLEFSIWFERNVD
jgi:uncharacterized protein YdcH (DUF465 family)